MADIKKELNDIKNAVYGREVRGSIHDGIKKINDEVENATDLSESAKHQVENIQQQVNQLVIEGDSSVEAAQARVDAENNTFSTLKERLDTKEVQFAAQLAQKANQGYVSSEINRVENIAKTSKVYQDRIPLNEISASRLKTTSQEDRIKLVNLHEEVLQAMAGNTPVNSIPADGSVTLEKLAPQLQSIFIAEGESW